MRKKPDKGTGMNSVRNHQITTARARQSPTHRRQPSEARWFYSALERRTFRLASYQAFFGRSFAFNSFQRVSRSAILASQPAVFGV